jgi:DNA repair exonuclease SbcCD ATPase subunit
MNNLQKLRHRVENLESLREKIDAELAELRPQLYELEAVENEARLNELGLSQNNTYKLANGYVNWYKTECPKCSVMIWDGEIVSPLKDRGDGTVDFKVVGGGWGSAPISMLIPQAPTE